MKTRATPVFCTLFVALTHSVLAGFVLADQPDYAAALRSVHAGDERAELLSRLDTQISVLSVEQWNQMLALAEDPNAAIEVRQGALWLLIRKSDPVQRGSLLAHCDRWAADTSVNGRPAVSSPAANLVSQVVKAASTDAWLPQARDSRALRSLAGRYLSGDLVLLERDEPGLSSLDRLVQVIRLTDEEVGNFTEAFLTRAGNTAVPTILSLTKLSPAAQDRLFHLLPLNGDLSPHHLATLRALSSIGFASVGVALDRAEKRLAGRRDLGEQGSQFQLDVIRVCRRMIDDQTPPTRLLEIIRAPLGEQPESSVSRRVWAIQRAAAGAVPSQDVQAAVHDALDQFDARVRLSPVQEGRRCFAQREELRTTAVACGVVSEVDAPSLSLDDLRGKH